METPLERVHDFWNNESCGEIYAKGRDPREAYLAETVSRYELEPYIEDFADFPSFANKDVLEVGVGMGSDHSSIAKASPKSLTGIDLTERAIQHTKSRLELLGLTSNLRTGNAEDLSFPSESFDAVYSWGVLHHSPNTDKCLREIHRVLRSGGVANIMIYHKYSPTGLMLWLRYALFAGKPFKGLSSIYSEYLESPGTKAYTLSEARDLLRDFHEVNISVALSFGDLLQGEVGQRHKGILLSIAKKIYPRTLVKALGALLPFGLMLLIVAKK